jgi:hypothetical protein
MKMTRINFAYQKKANYYNDSRLDHQLNNRGVLV